MMNKVFMVVLGFGCLWYAYYIYSDGWSSLYGHPISKGTGFLVGAFGILLLVFGLIPKKRDNDGKQ
jgi:hypothetical protein